MHCQHWIEVSSKVKTWLWTDTVPPLHVFDIIDENVNDEVNYKVIVDVNDDVNDEVNNDVNDDVIDEVNDDAKMSVQSMLVEGWNIS